MIWPLLWRFTKKEAYCEQAIQHWMRPFMWGLCPDSMSYKLPLDLLIFCFSATHKKWVTTTWVGTAARRIAHSKWQHSCYKCRKLPILNSATNPKSVKSVLHPGLGINNALFIRRTGCRVSELWISLCQWAGAGWPESYRDGRKRMWKEVVKEERQTTGCQRGKRITKTHRSLRCRMESHTYTEKQELRDSRSLFLMQLQSTSTRGQRRLKYLRLFQCVSCASCVNSFLQLVLSHIQLLTHKKLLMSREGWSSCKAFHSMWLSNVLYIYTNWIKV